MGIIWMSMDILHFAIIGGGEGAKEHIYNMHTKYKIRPPNASLHPFMGHDGCSLALTTMVFVLSWAVLSERGPYMYLDSIPTVRES